MSRHDWYRNNTWNDEIEAAFNDRYKRSRGDFSKVQYLRIQGLSLIDNPDPLIQQVGVVFFKRVLEEFPTIESEVNMTKEHLVNYYTNTEKWEEAAYYLQQLQNVKKKNGLSDELDFKFAENLLKRDNSTALEQHYPKISTIDIAKFTFNSQRFYALKVLALSSNKLGKLTEAHSYAMKALEASQVTRPDFARHPKIGLVHASEEEISQLNTILNR